MRWLLPVLIVTAISTQPRPYPMVMAIGQIASVVSVILACIVVVTTFPGRIWSIALVLLTVALRAARGLMPIGDEAAVIAYTVVSSLLFGAAGAIMAASRPRRLHRQLTGFMLISLPLMFLQLVGVGAWTQTLRLDFHMLGEEKLEQVRTLLVPPDEVEITTLQARPAGFLHANNFLSLFLVFALALQLGRRAPLRFSWRDVGLLAVLTLAMSKTAFLAFFLMLLVMLVAGDRARRRYALKSGAVFVACISTYAVLFPGVFAFTMSFDLMRLNLNVRVAEVLLVSGQPRLERLADQFSADELSRIKDDSAQSAYGILAARPTLVLGGALVAGPLYLLALRRVASRRPQWKMGALLGAAALLSVLGMTSFMGSLAFALMAGAALLSVWFYLEPGFGKLPDIPPAFRPGPGPHDATPDAVRR